MAARLPNPGSDKGIWGDVLNEYLSQSHNADGTLKPLAQSQVQNLTSDLAARVRTSNLDTQTASLVSNSSSATNSAVRGILGANTQILVLGPTDPVPNGTPMGTVIFRTI